MLDSNEGESSVRTPSFPPAAAETTARAELVEIASGNRVTRALIGRGYYGTLTPSVNYSSMSAPKYFVWGLWLGSGPLVER